MVPKGEIVIPANLLSPVCEAAHNLGVHDLIDFLPAPAKKTTPPTVQESSTQIDDEDRIGNASNNRYIIYSLPLHIVFKPHLIKIVR